jgi:hypothetical protein
MLGGNYILVVSVQQLSVPFCVSLTNKTINLA